MIKQRLDRIIQQQCGEENKERESFENLDLIDDLVETEFGIQIDIEQYGIEIFSQYNQLLKFLY